MGRSDREHESDGAGPGPAQGGGARSDPDLLARQRQLALDAARMGWWHYDPGTRIATYDERYREIFGVSGSARPNEEILKLLHPADLPRVWAAVEAALDPARPRPYSIEYRIIRPDGALRWIEAHGVAAFEGEGTARHATGFAGTVADVTDRKLAEEELRRAHGLIQSITQGTDDMIAAQDGEFRYLFFNDAYRREFRELWGRELQVGASMLEALAAFPEDQRNARALWSRALEGESFRVTAEFGPEEARQVYDLRFNPLRDAHGRHVGAAHILRNVTEQVRMQQALGASEARLREIAAELARANERLRANEERHRLVSLATRDVIRDWDLRTGALVWNDAVETTFGYALAEVSPDLAWWTDHVHPDDRARVIPALDAAIAEPAERSWAAEYRFRHRRGHFVDVLDRGFIARDESGRALRMIGSMLDLTERKHAERALRESRDTLQAVLDAAPVAVVVADADGRILMTSPATLRILGGPVTGDAHGPGEGYTLSRPDGSSIPAGRLPLSRALAGETVTLEEILVARADGSRATILASATPLRSDDGAVRGAVSVFKDISERKRAEEELRASEDRFRTLAAHLQEANERLRDADRRKDEFLAILSHELRNPLAPIRNSVYILERAGAASEQGRRAREIIDRQARHLTRLIDDLLDVTRISRGKISLRRQRLDLDALARAAAEDHREAFARSGIALELASAGAPLWVDGDPTRLAQVIGNLLSNSAKFTPRGGRTTVAVEAGAAGAAVVRVRDDGAGMSPETLAHLFEPFVQAQQTLDRSHGGLGLGLALVKGLVEMHGGRVEARSQGEGKGSEFTIVLPLAPAGRAAAAAPRDARGGARAQRVLVVEDNDDAAETLRTALELGGHEVAVARTGPEGVALARAFRPEVVLCDVGLPGMDGYAVARALRAEAGLPRPFLVALTGYALPEDVARAKEAGFDRHLAKPPGIDALERLIDEAAERSGGAADDPAPPR